MSRRVLLLLGGAATLAVAWVGVHTSAWEPDYRRPPVQRPAEVRQEPRPFPGSVPGPPPGACTPPPAERVYSCTYLVVRTPDP